MMCIRINTTHTHIRKQENLVQFMPNLEIVNNPFVNLLYSKLALHLCAPLHVLIEPQICRYHWCFVSHSEWI